MTYIHIEPKAFKEVSMFKWVHILRRFSSQAPRVHSDSAWIKLGSREKIKCHLSEAGVPATGTFPAVSW